MIPEFDSLDEAVRASFPTDSTRVVAVRQHDDVGFALFDTRPNGEPYLYEVYYDRRNGRWSEGSSSNGPGWHRTNDQAAVGVETVWGEAPLGADRVRAERDGHVVEETPMQGIYLLMWWDVAGPEAEVTAFRVNGKWVPAPTTWEQFEAQRQELLRARGSRDGGLTSA